MFNDEHELDDVRALLDIMGDDDVVYLVKKKKPPAKTHKISKTNKILPFRRVCEFAEDMTAENCDS